MKSHSGDMASFPHEDGGGGGGGGGAFSFCLRRALLWRTLVWGRIYGGILYFSLWGDDPRFSRLIVSIRLVEHLLEVNITYLLVICNFKDKLWHLF